MKKNCIMLLTIVLRYAKIKLAEGGETMVNSERVKQRMKMLGITQSDLAGKLSMSIPGLSLKLNNKRPLLLEEAEEISQILEIEDRDFRSYFFAQ